MSRVPIYRACRLCGWKIPSEHPEIVGLCSTCAGNELIRQGRLIQNLLSAPASGDRRHDSQPGRLIDILAGVFDAHWKASMSEVLKEMEGPLQQLREQKFEQPLLELLEEYRRLIETEFDDLSAEQQHSLKMCARSTLLKVLHFHDPVRIELRQWAETFGTIEASGCCSGERCPACEGTSCGVWCDLDPAAARRPLEDNECARCATLTVVLDPEEGDPDRHWECHGFVFEPLCPKCDADLGAMESNGGGKDWECEQCGHVIKIATLRGRS
jgi:hypothetical protein